MCFVGDGYRFRELVPCVSLHFGGVDKVLVIVIEIVRFAIRIVRFGSILGVFDRKQYYESYTESVNRESNR